MRLAFRLIACLVCAATLGACGPATAPPTATPSCADPKTLSIGDISANTMPVVEGMTPLADYLVGRLSAQCYTGWEIEVPATIEDTRGGEPGMITMMKDGTVDLYFDSLYPAAYVSARTGAEPILIQKRYCREDYHSVIMATKASGITSIADLPGHVVAMDQVGSTSGFVVPVRLLLDAGLKPSIQANFRDAAASDEVGIYFSGGDGNTADLLRGQEVDAGATDDFWYSQRLSDEDRDELVVLAETPPIPRAVALVRPGLDAGAKSAIKAALLAAEANPEGYAAMQANMGTCGFTELPPEFGANFEAMKEMVDVVRTLPGFPEDAMFQ